MVLIFIKKRCKNTLIEVRFFCPLFLLFLFSIHLVNRSSFLVCVRECVSYVQKVIAQLFVEIILVPFFF